MEIARHKTSKVDEIIYLISEKIEKPSGLGYLMGSGLNLSKGFILNAISSTSSTKRLTMVGDKYQIEPNIHISPTLVYQGDNDYSKMLSNSGDYLVVIRNNDSKGISNKIKNMSFGVWVLSYKDALRVASEVIRLGFILTEKKMATLDEMRSLDVDFITK